LSPKGEFWNRLERALDLSINVSEPAKNDLGNNPLRPDPREIVCAFRKAGTGIGQRKVFFKGLWEMML